MEDLFAIEVLRDSLTEEDNVRHDAGLESVDKRYQLMREPQYSKTLLALDDPRVTQLVTEANYDALRVSEKYRRPDTPEEIEEKRQSGINSMIRQLETQVSRIRKKATLDVFGIDTEFAQAETAAAAVKAGTAKAHQIALMQSLADYYDKASIEEAADFIIDVRAPALHELIDMTATLLWQARTALRNDQSIDAIQEQLDAMEAAL